MIEKIKITVPKNVHGVLVKDAEDFLFLKENKSVNMNDFINTLIVNYYEKFAATEEELADSIKNAIRNIPERYREEAFNNLVGVLSQREKAADGDKGSVALSFKPTKRSEAAVIHIESALLKGEALSSFYRRMLSSYCKRNKNERERIMCKENYELLQKSIQKGVQVCISLKTGDVFTYSSIHSVSAARDEMFNYVLSYCDKKNRTLRLAKISSVTLLNEKASIPQLNSELFDRQVICGAQYPIYATDNEPIRVRLSEKGKMLFGKIYLYRPVPISIEGDIYIFDCSANQALYYFERFGEEALILSPKKLGKFMRNYYYYALKKYRSVYGND